MHACQVQVRKTWSAAWRQRLIHAEPLNKPSSLIELKVTQRRDSTALVSSPSLDSPGSNFPPLRSPVLSKISTVRFLFVCPTWYTVILLQCLRSTSMTSILLNAAGKKKFFWRQHTPYRLHTPYRARAVYCRPAGRLDLSSPRQSPRTKPVYSAMALAHGHRPTLYTATVQQS